MATLLEDIEKQSDWIVQAFAADKMKLDYSIHSFMELDRFFYKHSRDGQATKGGRLAQNLGAILFGIGAYVGQTIVKQIPDSTWLIDDEDPEGEMHVRVRLPDGAIIFPVEKVMKRFSNGDEDALYPYIHQVADDFINEPFDDAFWEIASEYQKKPWWKF